MEDGSTVTPGMHICKVEAGAVADAPSKEEPKKAAEAPAAAAPPTPAPAAAVPPPQPTAGAGPIPKTPPPPPPPPAGPMSSIPVAAIKHSSFIHQAEVKVSGLCLIFIQVMGASRA